MDMIVLRQFQQQAEIQCRYAMWAADSLDEALRRGDVDAVFYSAQNLVGALGNAAKVFWGAGGNKSDLRKPVRQSVGVRDESPLRDLTMRNHYEHLDERIDRWATHADHLNIADMNIGPKGMIDGLENIEMFRQFDPQEGVLYFWGDELDLRVIMSDVAAFYPRLQREAARPHWE